MNGKEASDVLHASRQDALKFLDLKCAVGDRLQVCARRNALTELMTSSGPSPPDQRRGAATGSGFAAGRFEAEPPPGNGRKVPLPLLSVCEQQDQRPKAL